MADGVWKGVYPQVFGRSKQLSLNKFFDPSPPSMRKVDSGEKKRKEKKWRFYWPPEQRRLNDDRWNTARLCQNLFVFVKAEWELPYCMKIFALDMTWGDFFILLLQGQPNRFLNCNCSSLQIHKVSKCRSEVSRMSNLIQMIE